MSLFGIRSKQAASAAFASVGCFGNPIYDVPTGKYPIGILIELGAKRCTDTTAHTHLAKSDKLVYLGRLRWTPLLVGAADMAICPFIQGLKRYILICCWAAQGRCGGAEDYREIVDA